MTTFDPAGVLSSRQSWRGWKPWGSVLAPMLIAGVILLRGLSAVPLWVDELYTWKAVTGGLGETLGEPQYLPCYSVVWGYTTITGCQSEACLRMPSLLAMVLAVGFVAAASTRLFGPRAGLLSGVLMAMAPSVMRWGQDARPYGLAACLVGAALLCLVWALQSRRWFAWLGYGLATAASVLIVPMTASQMAGHALIIMTAPWSIGLARMWKPWVLAALPSVLLAGLLVVRFRSEIQGEGGFHAEDVFLPQVGNTMQMLMWPVTGNAFGTVSAGAFAMGIILLGIMSRPGVVFLLSGALAVLGLWIVSFVGSSFWLGRFAVPFVAFAFVGVGATVARLPWWQAGPIMAVMALAAMPTYTDNVLPWSRGYDWRSAMSLVGGSWQPGDAIVMSDGIPPTAEWSVDYYGGDHAYRIQTEPGATGNNWIVNEPTACLTGRTWELGSGNTITLCPPQSGSG